MRTKQLAALIAALTIFTSIFHASAAEVTVADMMEANTLENLLSRHTSVAVLQSIGSSQVATWVNRDYRYTAKRTDATVREGDTELLLTDQYALLFSYFRFKDGVQPVPVILLDAGFGKDVYYDLANGKNDSLLYDDIITAKEELQGVEEKDGKILMTTWLTGQAFKDGWGNDYPEGCYCELQYVLDNQTRELIKDTETVLDSQGRALKDQLFYQLFKDNTQVSQQVLYDTEMPEDLTFMIRALGMYLDAEEKDMRTVTFVFEAGTDKEREVTSKGAKGYSVLFDDGDYDYELYADAEMTVPAPMDDLNSDRRVYVKLIPPAEKE